MQLDLIVLMVGIQQDLKRGAVLDIAGIKKDSDNFILLPDPYFSSSHTGVEGIFCAGGITGPKTMEETLVEARAAAADINRYLGNEGLYSYEPANFYNNHD